MAKKFSSEQAGNATERAGVNYRISPAVIKRLPRYFRYLRELISADKMRISSSELSDMMNITASQIRQDLNCFGGFGQQGYGYNVKYLYSKISEILGVSEGYKAIIVGAGNLGRALVGSPMFEKRGVTLVALFDTNPEIIGTKVRGLTVFSMNELADYCAANHIDIAVLTLPREAARTAAERLCALNISGLWNFTNVELSMNGAGTVVQNVHIGDSLMQLTYKMKSKKN